MWINALRGHSPVAIAGIAVVLLSIIVIMRGEKSPCPASNQKAS